MMPWWARPVAVLGGVVIPLLAGAYFVELPVTFSSTDFRNGRSLISASLAATALLLGFVIARSLPTARPDLKRRIATSTSLDAVGSIAFFGTVILLAPIVTNPEQIQLYFSQSGSFDAGGLRGDASTLAGVRAMSQAATIYAALWGYTYWRTSDSVARRHIAGIWILGIATVLRSFVVSERLVAVEFFLPLILMRLASKTSIGRSSRLAIGVAPFGLPIFFAITEYFRSWRASYHAIYSSYWDFVTDRLVAYYALAFNHGSLLQRSGPPDPWYFYPYSGILELVAPLQPDLLTMFENPLPGLLAIYGAPEFTNATGIFPYIYAFGLPLTMAMFLLLGVILARTYEHFRLGLSTKSTLFYPVALLGVFEIPRIAYYSEPRFVATLLVLLIAVRRAPVLRAQQKVGLNA